MRKRAFLRTVVGILRDTVDLILYFMYLILKAAGVGVLLWVFLKIPYWLLHQTSLLNKILEILPVGEFGIYLYAYIIEAFLIAHIYLFTGHAIDTYHYNIKQEKEKQLSEG